MPALLIKLLVLSFIFAVPTAHGGGVALTERVLEKTFKAGKYERRAQLAMLGANDLSHASKVDNIHGLLELAEAENRIDPVQMLRYSRLYSKQEQGDHLLLGCLKVITCNPEHFLGIKSSSALHSEVVLRNPSLGIIQANHAVGAINENLMVRFFKDSGWESIPGQVGRQGIDGLFVKREGGVIKEVMIVESKYNTGMLQPTNHGIQMSEQWVKRKLLELRVNSPNNSDYKAIEEFVNVGAYRAILWNLKVENGSLRIGLGKVRSKGGGIDIRPLADDEERQISTSLIKEIRIATPKNGFEEKFIGWYKQELSQFVRK